MIGYLEMDSDHEIYMHAEWSVILKKYNQIFYSCFRIKVVALWSFSMFV